MVRQGRQEVVVDPFTDELVTSPKAEDSIGQAVELYAREPLIKAARRLVAGERDRLIPECVVTQHAQLHRCTVNPTDPYLTSPSHYTILPTHNDLPPVQSQVIHRLWRELDPWLRRS